MNKIILAIIGVVVFTILFPIALDSIVDAQTNVQPDAFPGCVVAAGSTAVVLTEDLFGDDVVSVTAITATGAGAVPVASVYVPATNTLTVTGLGADTPQDLTVSYLYDRTTAFTGLKQFMDLTPLLLWISVIAGVLFGGYMGIKSLKGA